MPEYHASFTTGPFSAGTGATFPLCDIRTGATDYPVITEISGMLDEASSNLAFVFGVGRPATLGTAKQNSIGFVTGDGASALPGLTVGTDWTVFPTAPTRYLRRVPMNSTANGLPQFKLLFPSGISIAPSSSLILWAITSDAIFSQTIGNFTVNVVLDA